MKIVRIRPEFDIIIEEKMKEKAMTKQGVVDSLLSLALRRRGWIKVERKNV